MRYPSEAQAANERKYSCPCLERGYRKEQEPRPQERRSDLSTTDSTIAESCPYKAWRSLLSALSLSLARPLRQTAPRKRGPRALARTPRVPRRAQGCGNRNENSARTALKSAAYTAPAAITGLGVCSVNATDIQHTHTHTQRRAHAERGDQ